MRLIQTYFNHRVSFTEVAEDIIKVTGGEWEKGDFMAHIPIRPYDLVLYVGSMMNIDVARYYRYIWWSDRHYYYGVTEGPPVLSDFNRAALNRMTVIAPSRYVAGELQKFGVSVSGVIPHGVVLDSIASAGSQPWRRLFGDRVVVLYVAHRNIRKGFRELIEAWRLTKAFRDPDVLLVLHTERRPNVNEDGYIIPEGGNIVITDNIHRLDRRSLYGLYKAADVYVHAALAEGFGIPIVEAMAAGKPVVCVDAPPMNEHVVTRETLVRVDRQVVYNDRGVANYRLNYPDLKDFAERIDMLVYDAGLRREIGEKNMARALEYDIWKTYSRFRNILW